MSAKYTEKKQYLSRYIFYIAYGILLFKNLIDHSTIQVFFSTESFLYNYIFRILSYSLILIKLFTENRMLLRQFILYAALILLSVMVFLCSNEGYVIDIAFLVVGAHGVDLKSIVKIFFIFTSIAIIVLMLLSICGLIINYKIYGEYGEQEMVRYSFGSTYPTDFAARIFYVELAYTYLKKNKHDILYLLFWLSVGLFVWFFCRARLNTILIICFALAVFINTKFPKVYKYKIIKFLLIYSMILCCVISISLHALYSKDNSLLYSLNIILSNRLMLGKVGIDEYGFSLFGKIIEMNGNGFTTQNIDWSKGYFYIDCGFLKIALTNGIIYLLFFVAFFTVAARKAVKSDNIVLGIIITFLALTSIVDHHIVEVGYNPFLFLITGVLLNFKKGYHRQGMNVYRLQKKLQ